MSRLDDQVNESPGTGGVRPGELSALLQEIARSPAEPGSSWDRSLRPAAVIGRFELERELGRGGFGVVWEARDRELGRRVAFKAVLPGRHHPSQEERLLLEAEAAARLSHPNIVTLHEAGRSEHGPYLVFELLEGKTLARRLAEGALPQREALRVGVEIAKAVAYAHAHGVVHRDLKPENVFLCDDGRVKVLDFGLAHAFGRRRFDGGTPAYMAPEQAAGAPEDERTDVFALGVLLFTMLSGTLPFEGERARRSHGRAPVLEVPGAPALGELVARMLSDAPVARPRDGTEVLSALSSFAAEMDRAPSSPGPVRTRSRLRSSREIWIAGAVAASVAVAVAGAWLVRHRVLDGARPETVHGGGEIPAPPSPGAAASPSIAVLPFADVSPGKDQEYFSDGIADEILTALAEVKGLRVIGRASSFSFKGRNEDLRTIGRRLDVANTLEGSVRKEGQRVRITADLVNAADGSRMWSKTFDKELTGIFAVQEEIARAVVAELEVKLASKLVKAVPPTAERRTTSPEAFTQYLLGKQLWQRNTARDFRLSMQAYEKALAVDPGYAPARAQLATVLRAVAYGETDPASAASFRRRALEEAERALALAPDLAEARSIRGFLRFAWLRDWTGAFADLRRAVELSPSDSPSHRRLGTLLASQGRLAEALLELENATRVDPLDPVSWNSLGDLQSSAGRIDLARAAHARALEISPGSEDANQGLAICDLLENRSEDALARATLRDPPDLFLLAIAHHARGNARESRRALDQLIRNHGHNSAEDIAKVYSWRGDADRAFEWLDRALDQELWDVKFSVSFRGLRTDRRWGELLRKMNLPPD